MAALLSSLLVVVLVATQNVLGQQQPMMTGSCRANEAAIGPCYNGYCPAGTYCSSYNGFCCASNYVNTPAPPPSSSACPAGRAEVGPCLNSNCQTGAQCFSNRCCSFCPVNYDNIGPCIGGTQCPPPATCQNSVCCKPPTGRK